MQTNVGGYSGTGARHHLCPQGHHHEKGESKAKNRSQGAERGKTLASPSQRDVVLKKQGGKEKHLSLGEAGGACTKAEKEKRTECAQKCMRAVRLENWFHAREQRGTIFCCCC